MANFQNNKPFLTVNSDQSQEKEIRPEYLANALMRQAIQNAQATGNDIRTTLIHTLGLPAWMVDLAKLVDYNNLEIWQLYLRRGDLSQRGVTLAQVEMLIRIKQHISEELMTRPEVDEVKHNQFKSTIETAVTRKAERPKRSNNSNFTPEKGSHEAPDYDGKDETYDKQGNLWVFPTRIVQWVIDEDGQGKPGETIVKISDLDYLYKKKMKALAALAKAEVELSDEMKKKDVGIPIQHLKYEVKDWIRAWKPSVQEIYARPDKERRNAIEFYKQRELDKLTKAIQAANDGRGSAYWKMAYQYCGTSAGVALEAVDGREEDLSLAKRIENQIRRKFQAKKTRVEGKAYLPPMAAGDMLLPQLDARVELLVSKNPKLNDEWPWVIEVYFDAEAREDMSGDGIVTPGVGIAMNKYLDAKNSN
jgi:hypothetical protein